MARTKVEKTKRMRINGQNVRVRKGAAVGGRAGGMSSGGMAREFRSLGAPRPATLTLSGPPGSGKTRCHVALCVILRALGATVEPDPNEFRIVAADIDNVIQRLDLRGVTVRIVVAQ